MGQQIRNEHPRFVLDGSSRKKHSIERLPDMALRKRLEDQLMMVDTDLARQLESISVPMAGTFKTRFRRTSMTAHDWDALILLGYLVAQREAIVQALEMV